jgi:hypothetical protein
MKEIKNEEERKNCLFQYATKNKIIEDTDLITLNEAKKMWEKYLPDIIDRWNDSDSPEMCIWTGCDSNTSYHTAEFDIDYRDCELSEGKFYKINKKEICL